MWAVGEGGQGAQGTGTVNSDGSWSATINLTAAGVKDQQRTTLSFACLDYNNNTIKSLGLSLQADSTTLNGSYTLTSEADGSQTIAVDVTGFAPNEEATFRLVPENAYNSETGPVEGDFTVLSTFTADAEGAVSHRFTAPVDVPDGRYKAGVFGIAYGEHAWFQNVLVKSGKMYYVDDGSGTGQAGGDNNAQQPAPGVEDPAAPADPQRTWRTAPASRVLNVGMGLVNVVVVAVIALTVPNLINNSFDRFVRITTSAAVSYDGFPTVAEISAAAAGGE